MTKRTFLLPLAAAVMLVPLSACNEEPEAPVADAGAAAQGEVLPGTVDDAMIPLDQLQSQGEPVTDGPEEGEDEEGEAVTE